MRIFLFISAYFPLLCLANTRLDIKPQEIFAYRDYQMNFQLIEPKSNEKYFVYELNGQDELKKKFSNSLLSSEQLSIQVSVEETKLGVLKLALVNSQNIIVSRYEIPVRDSPNFLNSLRKAWDIFKTNWNKTH